MTTFTTKFSIAILGLGTLLGLTSCSSTSSGTTGSHAVAGVVPDESLLIPAASLNQLKPGMTTQQITSLIGKPEIVRQLNVQGIHSEVWVYRISSHDSNTQEPTGTRDVPYYDPATGLPKMIQEPVYQNKTQRIYQTLELLMINGKLEQRKPGRPEVETLYI